MTRLRESHRSHGLEIGIAIAVMRIILLADKSASSVTNQSVMTVAVIVVVKEIMATEALGTAVVVAATEALGTGEVVAATEALGTGVVVAATEALGTGVVVAAIGEGMVTAGRKRQWVRGLTMIEEGTGVVAATEALGTGVVAATEALGMVTAGRRESMATIEGAVLGADMVIHVREAEVRMQINIRHPHLPSGEWSDRQVAIL